MTFARKGIPMEPDLPNHFIVAVLVPADTTVDSLRERVAPTLDPHLDNTCAYWSPGMYAAGAWSDYDPTATPPTGLPAASAAAPAAATTPSARQPAPPTRPTPATAAPARACSSATARPPPDRPGSC
jgi:hypothetical protein